MYFIGDCHGDWNKYRYLINKMQLPGGNKGMDCSLVVGDMGIGFADKSIDNINGKSFIKNIPLQHKFIVGNHDDRRLSYEHPNCLGDYGYNKNSGIFYVSGGLSIDKECRNKGVDWWDNEELSPGQMVRVLELYKQIKPSIVVAHECPTEIKYFVTTNPKKTEIQSRTEILLQNMVDIHRPDYFIFGHHHTRITMAINNIEYVCLDTLSYNKYKDCYFQIPEITW